MGALSAPALAQSMLDYIDVQAVAMATSSQVQHLLNAINGGLQEVFEKGPAHLRKREWAAIVHPPTSVVLNVSANSTVITMTGWEAWMAGCTIRIPGDGADVVGNTVDNELVDQTTLLQPYQGQSQTAIQATVFGDAINLDATISTVLGSPRLADIRELHVASGREDFNRASFYYEADYGEQVLQVQARPRWVGQPTTYWVDSVYLTGSAATQPALRIRLTPMPIAQYVLKWDAEMNPPQLAAADLANSSYVFQLPGNKTEMLVMAVVLQRWTSCPWFKNKDAKDEIARQYKEAIAGLYSTKPQNRRARYMVPMR